MSLYRFDGLSRAFSLEKLNSAWAADIYQHSCLTTVRTRTAIACRCLWFLSCRITVHRWSLNNYWKRDALVCNFPHLAQTPYCLINRSLYVSQAHVGAKFGVWLGRGQPSANVFVHAGCDQSAKFNFHQIFRLYTMWCHKTAALTRTSCWPGGALSHDYGTCTLCFSVSTRARFLVASSYNIHM